MTTLREAAQQALEALEYDGLLKKRQAIAALRAALAQEQAEPDAYPYASRLAASIWERHYKGEAQNWKPLDDLMGVLTQIDNMTTGLTRQGQEQEQAEPVAWLQPKTVDAHARPDLGYETCAKNDYGAFPVYATPHHKQAAAELRRLHTENERLKTVPMKYRRMEFNAQLQAENERLIAQRDALLEALIKCRDRFFPADQPERDRDELWEPVTAAIKAAEGEKK